VARVVMGGGGNDNSREESMPPRIQYHPPSIIHRSCAHRILPVACAMERKGRSEVKNPGLPAETMITSNSCRQSSLFWWGFGGWVARQVIDFCDCIVAKREVPTN
jgi:hypothetical protein